jgi:outer membrane protein assembly factor BamB
MHIPVTPTEPPSSIDNKVKQPILPINQPSEKQNDTNIDLSKVPELKIDFTKYPTLDFDKLSEKHYRIVAETDQKINMLSDRGDHFIQGDFIVVEFTCIGYGVSCIDKNTMKVLWDKPNFNLYGCTKDMVVCYIATLDEADDSIYAFDIKTGKLKWKYNLQSWVDQWFGISSTSINENEMIFTSYTQEQHYNFNKKDGITFAIDSKTGRELWRIPVVIFGFSLEEYGNKLLYCDQKFNISAVDRKTGKVIWTNLEINKESKESLDFSILPLKKDKVLLYSLDRNLVTKYFVLNVNNGNIELKKYQYLLFWIQDN